MISSRPTARSRRRTAFTLTELIVVIAIIVLLISLLLAALGAAQQKARQTSTLATMRSFSAACESFHQEHDFYPGAIPERTLAEDTQGANGGPLISGTENALLHLMGGYVRETDVGSSAYMDDYTTADGWEEFSIGTGPYLIKVAANRLGEGPTIGNKPFAPYFTPTSSDFSVAAGQEDGVLPLPDLIDAWGQPIIYLRRQRSVGPMTDVGGSGTVGQFSLATARPYIESMRLGRLGQNQEDSLFRAAPDPAAFLDKVLEHPALPGQPQGAFMLLSAGPDGVYYSSKDGAGNETDPIVDIVEVNSGKVTFAPEYSAEIFAEYDDVLQFGGS